RLVQLVGLITMINPFLLQPVFARIDTKKKFVSYVRIVCLGLFVMSIACMVTVYWVPLWWLYLLGAKYGGLTNELPLAIAGALFYLWGVTLYTLVVSRNITRGQSWAAVAGLSTQIIFVSIHGVESTSDALVVNLLP